VIALLDVPKTDHGSQVEAIGRPRSQTKIDGLAITQRQFGAERRLVRLRVIRPA
jgi:hypothetical protein